MVKNKDTFILLQELYDSIDTLIFCYENDEWNSLNINDLSPLIFKIRF